MTNDLERVTRIADEIIGGRVTCNGLRYDATAEQLLTFEQAVLSTKQDALERKCITANEELLMKEIESLQAKLAMLREIYRDAEMWHSSDTLLGKELRMQALNALNDTQIDVDNWMAKKKAEWVSEAVKYLDDNHTAMLNECLLPSQLLKRMEV